MEILVHVRKTNKLAGLYKAIKTDSPLAKESVSLTTDSLCGFVMPQPIKITASSLSCHSGMFT